MTYCASYTPEGRGEQKQQQGSYATTVEMPLSVVWMMPHIEENGIVQTVKLTVRSAQRQSVGQRGLSRGGGVCPMCRLSDGEKRGTAQRV